MSKLISMKEITNQTGLSKNYIYRQSLAGKIPPPVKREKRVRWWREQDVTELLEFKIKKKEYESRIETIKKLKKEGLSHREIAKKLNFDLKTFNLYMRKANKKKKTKPKKNKLRGFELAMHLLSGGEYYE